MMPAFSCHDEVDLPKPHQPSCTLYLCEVYLTVIGSDDRIFFSSSAKDPEAKGAIPKSASERKETLSFLRLAGLHSSKVLLYNSKQLSLHKL